ncbi:MAG: right-handed parallel beta-helix repeat-containing protein [Thermoanaerobaculia bacterium]|nr:right-handed parallel beta-helix repeat-containing protein [Thermoanaerobaculia bacterium]
MLSSNRFFVALCCSIALAASSTPAAAQLETFTLPLPNPGSGIHRPDLQASFPEVDWQTLDRLYIPAGHFKYIRLGNLPIRSADNPLVISNIGGQVRVGGLGHYYTFIIGGGANWKLTGKYDGDAATGDAAFPGHDAGYAHSQDTYGILIDDFLDTEGATCLVVGGEATDFEIEYLEIRGCNFAGMSIKTDDDGDATMANVSIHDNYIHDVKSEGFYIGSTQGEPQHTFTNLRLYNNRVIRTGTEILQVGQLGDGSEIYNNVFLLGALEWKNPFQNFQDNASQYGGRFGDISVHHNIFIGGASSMLIFFGQGRTGDIHDPADTQSIAHNYFSHGRNTGVYVHSSADGVSTYRFEGNSFRQLIFQYNEVNPGNPNHNAVFRVFNTENPIELIDNRWDGGQVFTAGSPSAQIVQSGNVNGPIPPVEFVDSGFPADFDYLRVELWTDLDYNGAAVTYEVDDYVTHEGQLYKALAVNDGRLPPDSPDVWQLQPMPADDVRLAVNSPFQGYGLLDNPGNAFFVDGFESGNLSAWSAVFP